ncbi:MAG: hypothetical protein QM775_35130 [Pirellulales bacterium]
MRDAADRAGRAEQLPSEGLPIAPSNAKAARRHDAGRRSRQPRRTGKFLEGDAHEKVPATMVIRFSGEGDREIGGDDGDEEGKLRNANTRFSISLISSSSPYPLLWL